MSQAPPQQQRTTDHCERVEEYSYHIDALIRLTHDNPKAFRHLKGLLQLWVGYLEELTAPRPAR